MKRLLYLLSITLAIPSFSQTIISDSVSIEAGYANKAFYSLSGGNKGSMINNNWDIAVATYTLMTASVRINGGFGTQLWRYINGDTTAWNALDTAGLGSSTGWVQCFDQDTAFEPSAFEYGMTSFDYGWGVYNNVTHDVVGTAVFFMKSYLGVYKKVWIKNQKAINNTMTIRIANLDNTGDTTVTFSKNYLNKNYIYLSLADMNVMDPEPNRADYDLIFDKYLAYLNPPGQYYPVSGVRLNQNTKAYELRNTQVDDAINDLDLMYTSASSNMTEIGHDWKIAPPPAWAMVDSLSYFVSSNNNQDIYQIWFTNFSGAASGKYYFNLRQLAWISVEENNQVLAKISVYPNPAAEWVNYTYSTKAGVDATMTLTDINGRMVYTCALPSTSGELKTQGFSPKSHNLKSGVYFLTLISGDKTEVEKLIIQ